MYLIILIFLLIIFVGFYFLKDPISGFSPGKRFQDSRRGITPSQKEKAINIDRLNKNKTVIIEELDMLNARLQEIQSHFDRSNDNAEVVETEDIYVIYSLKNKIKHLEAILLDESRFIALWRKNGHV